MKNKAISAFMGIFLFALIILRLFHPGTELQLPQNAFQKEQGFAYRVADKASWPLKREILENDIPLPEASNISELRKTGNGQYSWLQNSGLYFAPSNNTDPRKGENIFTVRTFIFVRIRHIAIAISFLLLSLTANLWSQRLLKIFNKILPPSKSKKKARDSSFKENAAFLNTDSGMSWSEFNILNRMQNYWSDVDRRYKTVLTVAFPVALLTFSIFVFHYLYTDHGFRLPDITPQEQYFAGRWFAEFCYWLLGYSNIPVLQQILALAFLLGAGVITLRLWGINSLTHFSATIILLAITVHPNNLAPFFYTWQTPVFTFSMLLASSAVLLVSHANYKSRIALCTRVVIGGILISLAAATYQAGISVAATLAVGYAIIRLTEHSENMRDFFCRQFFPVYSIVLSGIIGGVFYIASLRILGRSGDYNNQSRAIPDNFTDILHTFSNSIRQSFEALWITQPEFSRTLKIVLLATLFLGVCFLASTILHHHSNQKRIAAVKLIALLFLVFCFVLAPKLLFFTIAIEQGFFIYRSNLATPFFIAFGFYAIFSTASDRRFDIWRSLATVSVCCVVFVFIRTDLLRQGMLLAGQRHDLAMTNRILERMEALPELDFSKRYYLVRIGSFSSERRRMLNTLQPYNTTGGGHMDGADLGSTGGGGATLRSRHWAADCCSRELICKEQGI